MSYKDDYVNPCAQWVLGAVTFYSTTHVTGGGTWFVVLNTSPESKEKNIENEFIYF